jgi:hypothetical protein
MIIALIVRQGRVPHDAFDGEENVIAKTIAGDENPGADDEDEEDLDPTYSATNTTKE